MKIARIDRVGQGHHFFTISGLADRVTIPIAGTIPGLRQANWLLNPIGQEWGFI